MFKKETIGNFIAQNFKSSSFMFTRATIFRSTVPLRSFRSQFGSAPFKYYDPITYNVIQQLTLRERERERERKKKEKVSRMPSCLSSADKRKFETPKSVSKVSEIPSPSSKDGCFSDTIGIV